MANMTNITIWIKGLIAAVIGGVANTVGLMIIDPLTFNLNEGFNSLLKAGATSAIVSAALYLKQSPIPSEGE